MRYLPIIQLDVAHSYYQNGYCPAFHIEPDRKTKKILRDHRCIFKSRPGGFLVAQTVNDNDVPVIELAVSTKFRFMMWPADANCLLFTDMSNFYSHRTALFTNKGVDDNKLKLTSDISQERRVFAGIEIEITDALK